MTQIVLNIEDQSIAKAILSLVRNMSGVEVVSPVKRRRKSGIALALEDVKEGRVTEYASVKDLIAAAKE